MAFDAPDLVVNIDPVAYRTELDANFAKIDTALAEIEAELPSAQLASGSSNADWISRVLGSSGIVGTESFVLTFATDHEDLTISHPSNGSSCVINGLLHTTGTTSEDFDLQDLVSVDGTFRIVIAAKSLGAPNMSLVVESVSETEALVSADLILFDFDLTRSGGSYTVTNLRRQTNLLLSQSSFEDNLIFPVFFQNSVSSTGVVPGNSSMPFDCEVISAVASMADPPSLTTDPEIRIELIIDEGTAQIELLTNPFVWTDDVAENNSRKVDGFSPNPIQVAEGTEVKLDVTQFDSSAFHVVTGHMLVRKISTAILR